MTREEIRSREWWRRWGFHNLVTPFSDLPLGKGGIEEEMGIVGVEAAAAKKKNSSTTNFKQVYSFPLNMQKR